MILISNKQRDDSVRYLDLLCSILSDRKDNKSYNTCRLARKLAKQLRLKQQTKKNPVTEK